MKTVVSLRIIAFTLFIICFQDDLKAQASCSAAYDLTQLSCHTGNIQNAASAAPSGTCVGATAATPYGVWYTFTASTTTATISLSAIGANLGYNSTYIQVLNNGTCGGQTVVACQVAGTNATTSVPVVVNGLTSGATYFIRIYVTGAPTTNPANKWVYTITLQQPPINDICSSTVPLLTSAATCTTTSGTLSGATSSSSAVTSTCTGTPGADIWYRFVAQANNATITLSNAGSSLATPYIQLLSGSCGTFTSVACSPGANNAATVTAGGLTTGNTYYIRIYTTTALPTGCGWNFSICVTHVVPPANDICSNSETLTSALTCTNTSGTLAYTTASNPAVASTCAGTPGADVWYTFVAQANNATVSLSSLGSNLTTAAYIQVLSSTCGSFATVACANATSLIATGLTPGTTYYVRIYATTALPLGANWTFNICVTYVVTPANDDCNHVVTLVAGTSCSSTSGTLAYTTVSNPAITSACSGTPGADVWYKFVAQSVHASVALSSIGASFSGAGTRIQLLSGACGGFTSLACVTGTTSTLTLNTANIAGLKLDIGYTYYVRIYSPTALPTSGTWGFDICVTDVSARIDYSRSYINISKGTNGGTVDVGDTLEMRATFVIRAKTVDSLSFTDTLFNGKGLRLIPGSIATRTNEGKIYGNTTAGVPAPFSDAVNDDAGWRYVSGLDTVIRVNFGTGATFAKRGQLANTSRPSVYTSTCIIMATYRVVVYASYDTKVNFKTGSLTYRDPSVDVSTVNKLNFAKNEFIVYRSPGLCPNAVSATNAFGAEYNGTFGTPVRTFVAPDSALARNRGTTSHTSYIYAPFVTDNGPNDYYYGIANNTSAYYSTVNTWNKPDNSSPSHRVFKLWDITGDHTGAANTATGNPACDTTKPVSATNPCGYMLVINSAYRADTAFYYTVSNLCPNTYYEISAWFKNICSKCGCDSTGLGAGGSPNTGYIPTATGDSSGVYPNLAFDVNGYDYYTTGNIKYYGTWPNSDVSNKWVKRGFTYLTGPSETSFMLTIRNNAPGGGGNDWAMDDISVSTCLPNMKYSPSLNPVTCVNNPVQIYDTVRSYFNNYGNYKWQRSTNGGTTWTDLGQTGSVTPVLNNSEYQYVTSYTIPPTNTTATNNGDKYRVTVATTSANLGNNDCQFTDGISIIDLEVLTDCTVLPTNILSFTGKLVREHATLFWTASHEDEQLQYSIERSTDGIRYVRIGVRTSQNQNTKQTYYTFTDSVRLTGKAWYRIAMINQQNRTLYSRNIALSGTPEAFSVYNVLNPFYNDLFFDVAMNRDAKVTAALYTLSGTRLAQQAYTAVNGINGFTLTGLKAVPQGMYLLQVRYGNETVTRKVIKR